MYTARTEENGLAEVEHHTDIAGGNACITPDFVMLPLLIRKKRALNAFLSEYQLPSNGSPYLTDMQIMTHDTDLLEKCTHAIDDANTMNIRCFVVRNT